MSPTNLSSVLVAEQDIDHLADMGGWATMASVSPRGGRREPTDVGEQDGHLATLAARPAILGWS
jgi:hypothetical protein